MAYERNFKLLNSKFRELLIPSIIISISGNISVLIDAFLISFILGAKYLSVVQCFEPVVFFFVVLYWMIGLGGSVLCSIAKADFDDELGNKLFTVSLVSIIAISSLITIFSLLFSDSIVQILCSSDAIRPFVKQYFVCFLIGMPFLSYLLVVSYFIRSYGFLKFQFWTYIVFNVMNVICDIIFMKYFNWGIAGAGLATTTGVLIAACIISYYFFNPKKPLKIVKIKVSAMLNYLVEICKSGLSVASTQLYMSARYLFINYLLIILGGEIGLAVLNICSNSLFLVVIFIFGVLQSILPIVSVYYKEEDYNGVDYVTHKSLKIVIAIAFFFSLLLIIFPEIILVLFNAHDPSVVPVALNAVRLFAFCFMGYAICNLYIFYAQSVQYNKLANYISFLEGLLFPIIFAYLFGYLFGLNGVWIAFPTAEFCTVLFIFIYSRYFTKKTNGEYSGFFLNKSVHDDEVYGFTLKGTIDDVVQLSEKIQAHLSDSKSGMKVCLAIEEMLTHIIKINGELDLIDIIIKDKKEEVLISIKYSGIPCNPLEDKNIESSDFGKMINDSVDYSKMADLNEIADKIEYSQILELNNVVLIINH